MSRVISIARQRTDSIRIVFAICLLFMGGMIYLLFRTESLLMFQWVGYLHVESFIYNLRENASPISIPAFCKFCLPDGLWISSYIIVVDTIWRGVSPKRRLIWCMSLPLIAIITELMQFCNIIVGTFDYYDLLSYIIPTLVFLIFYRYGKRD